MLIPPAASPFVIRLNTQINFPTAALGAISQAANGARRAKFRSYFGRKKNFGWAQFYISREGHFNRQFPIWTTSAPN